MNQNIYTKLRRNRELKKDTYTHKHAHTHNMREHKIPLKTATCHIQEQLTRTQNIVNKYYVPHFRKGNEIAS